MQDVHLDHANMVTSLKKSGQDILGSLDARKASASHMLVGIYDETLELSEQLSLAFKGVRTDVVLEGIKEEAGDLSFYLQGLHQDLLGKNADEEKVCELCEDSHLREKSSDPLADFQLVIMDLATPVKRHIYYNKPLDETEVGQKIEKALAELAIIVYEETGFTMADCRAHNLNKLLKGRYKSGTYSDDAANTREDKQVDTTETKA